MGRGGDSFGREEIIKEGELGVKTGAKKFACDDEVGEEAAIALTEETLLTGEEQE